MLKARSRRETESEKGVKSYVVDPKPGDLPMDRLKREESSVEDRTHYC